MGSDDAGFNWAQFWTPLGMGNPKIYIKYLLHVGCFMTHSRTLWLGSVEIPVHRELCSENTPPVAAQVTQSRSVGVIFPDITSGRRPQVMGGKVTPTWLLCHECCYVAYFHYTTSDVPVYPISIIYFLSKYEEKNVLLSSVWEWFWSRVGEWFCLECGSVFSSVWEWFLVCGSGF